MMTKSRQDDVEINPLISAAQLPRNVQPTIEIPEERRIPLSELGTKRAKNSRGTIENHIRGILGEFAVAKFLGIPDSIDEEIYEFGDPGYDLIFRNRTIDVKTVGPQWDNPRLMIPEHHDISSDFYVLVQEISSQIYRILGYAPATVVANAQLRRIPGDSRRRRARTVQQYKLWPLPRSIAAGGRLQHL
jgi:hypothetical protein